MLLGATAFGQFTFGQFPAAPVAAVFPTIALAEDSAYYEAEPSDAPAFEALANDEPGIW